MGSLHEEPGHGIGDLLSGLQEAYGSGRTKDLAWRRAQLKGLLRLLTEKEEEIFDALHDDLGKHRAESYRDEAQAPLVSFPATALVVPEPLGVVLVFSCWNLPLGLALEPVSGALAAGNVVVVKPSELAPSTAAFLAANIPRYLDPKAVKVILGGPEVGEQLMEHRWDKVLFTGSANVGRLILTKAAKHLTPVALELGSKCPCIVDQLDSKRDRQIAVNRIAGAKWSVCAGQACVAIDYILVEEKFAPILIELLKSTVKRFTATPECMAKILNTKHFQRLSNFLDDDRVARSVVHGGSVNQKTLTIEPTILLNPPLDSDIMTEEIFGPLLPIITYVVEGLPFGGVGQSGFGQYHGKYSFELFSNKKAVFKRSFLIEFMFRYPPWDDSKIGMLRHVFNTNYILLLLGLLGLRR
uniref:Aldehyde dehydrogenase n=1 Tax=Aegilops tauschii TaxID=37682 RepID=M8BRN1_AEGTA